MDEVTDFLCQMEIATLEEMSLYEIPRGSVDLVAGGPVSHGPWPASACAAVLKLWYDRGWIDLYLPSYPQEWNLEPAAGPTRLHDDGTLVQPDARQLLDQPARWILERVDGHVAPYQTDAGRATPPQQWYDAARDIVRQLPLREPGPES